MILGRCYAFNAVSLVDFVARDLEEYYRKRLLEFAHGRLPYVRLILEKLYAKAIAQFPKGPVDNITTEMILLVG